MDKDLQKQDVRLTQGGEPTFVSIDDMDGPEWNTLAHGEKKRELAGKLALKLKAHFANGGLLHYGQGKWYPGEPLPRWAINMYWRIDGKPIWRDASLFADEQKSEGYTLKEADLFARHLAMELHFPQACLIPAYEDVLQQVNIEQNLPENIDPLKVNLKDSEERRRLARLLESGLGEVVGFVMPIKPIETKKAGEWLTSKWPLKREHLYLLGGDSPMGLRLPLSALPWVLPEDMEAEFPLDTFAELESLATYEQSDIKPKVSLKHKTAKPAPKEVIHTALCVQVRAGRLYVFMPPVNRLEDYLALVTAVENTAAKLNLKLWIEGYTPPRDARIQVLSVTPDPGVIEVNIHPSASWQELVDKMTVLYEEATPDQTGHRKIYAGWPTYRHGRW